MKLRISLVVVLGLFLGLSACEDYVQSVDPLIDQVEDDRLNSGDQVPFLTLGVLQRMATVASNAGMLSGGLSDELVFDQDLPRATFPTYQEIEDGLIKIDNNSIDGLLFNIGEARFFADDLVRRLNESINDADPEDKREALYTAYLVGGLMRQYYASYIGLQPEQPGGVIDAGPFIPAAQMYSLALEKYQLALAQASTEDGGYQTRVINSLIARIHLYTGDYAQAAQFAAQGLVPGDDTYMAMYNTDTPNAYFFGGHLDGRVQWVVDFRFNDYVAADAAESARLPLRATTGQSGNTWYTQNKFPVRGSSYPITSWQEMALIQAEVGVRNGTGDPLGSINSLRASYGLGALASVDLNTIIEERDKTLFLTGHRLVDQKRFGIWHLPAGRWQVLRITERELNANPNLSSSGS